MKLSHENNSQKSLSLSLSLSLISKLALPALALISITAGIAAGSIFRTNHKDSSAASANITVRDNDQTIEQDQSTREIIITRTSIVTIKNPEANYGYTLSAKLTTTIPNATVAITSPTSTDCPTDTPCLLNTSTPITILTTTDNTATEANGDTTTFTVSITIPAGTAVSDYVLDIEYQEEANPIPPGPSDPGTSHGAMQALTNEECPTEQYKTAFDARNGQIYYVRKIAGLCWMESNLRYAGGGDYEEEWSWEDDRKTIAEGVGITTDAPYYYNYPGSSEDYTNTAAVGGFYGYFYNWCAAMGGQANACNNTSTSGFTSVSICPAGWRLPTTGELQSMYSSIGGAPAKLLSEFLAVYSGGRGETGFGSQGTGGRIWSFTVASKPYAYALLYTSSSISLPYTDSKAYGFSVRCVY